MNGWVLLNLTTLGYMAGILHRGMKEEPPEFIPFDALSETGLKPCFIPRGDIRMCMPVTEKWARENGPWLQGVMAVAESRGE